MKKINDEAVECIIRALRASWNSDTSMEALESRTVSAVMRTIKTRKMQQPDKSAESRLLWIAATMAAASAATCCAMVIHEQEVFVDIGARILLGPGGVLAGML